MCHAYAINSLNAKFVKKKNLCDHLFDVLVKLFFRTEIASSSTCCYSPITTTGTDKSPSQLDKLRKEQNGQSAVPVVRGFESIGVGECFSSSVWAHFLSELSVRRYYFELGCLYSTS